MHTLASVALNFTQGPGASCVACVALCWKPAFRDRVGVTVSDGVRVSTFYLLSH